MAEVKFAKDSPEFVMFNKFWRMCQKYWDCSNQDDEYWESLLKDTKEFTNEFETTVPLALRLQLALVEELEDKHGRINVSSWVANREKPTKG